jgi:hypothetical protein
MLRGTKQYKADHIAVTNRQGANAISEAAAHCVFLHAGKQQHASRVEKSLVPACTVKSATLYCCG